MSSRRSDGATRHWNIGLVELTHADGFVAILRGGGGEQKTFGPEIDAAAVLHMVIAELENRDMAEFVEALEKAGDHGA